MSSEPIDGSEDAQVVPLRAKDAGTEAKVAEAAGPAYTDLSDDRAARKPVIPAHWRTCEAAREHVKLALARYGHSAAYHGIRLPAYAVLTVWWAAWVSPGSAGGCATAGRSCSPPRSARTAPGGGPRSTCRSA
jgi:hypothetical protein